jgi:hypothetical protein
VSALASWAAPVWAATSRAEDNGVTHSLRASAAALLVPEVAAVAPHSLGVLPEVYVTDELCPDGGRVDVVRSAPLVIVDALLLDINQARVLALGILEILDALPAGAR